MKSLAGVFVSMVLLGGAARAEDATSKERLEALEKKVKLLEQQQHAPAKDASPEQSIEWSFKDGFQVKGTVGGTSFELRPRVRIQLDYRGYPRAGADPATPHSVPEDQFLLRRARVGFSGAFGDFGFEIDVDPTRSPLPLADCWLQYQPFEEIRLRAGHFKSPFGLDNITSSRYLDCVERPMIEGGGAVVAPNYRNGAMLHGKIEKGLLGYYLSVQSQPDSNTVTISDPLLTARVQTSFAGLQLGGAALFARIAAPSVTSYAGRTPGQHQFFAPVNVRGWQQGYEVDVSQLLGPFWISAELVWAQQERRRVGADGTSGTPLITQGAWVTAGWMFWGPSTKGPHGATFKDWELFSLDLEKKRNGRNVGAELVCRLEWIDIRDARGGRRYANAAMTAPGTPGTAPNTVVVKGNQATALTVGLNLYPTENVRFMLDYVRVRTGDEARAERARSRWGDEILVRAQFEF